MIKNELNERDFDERAEFEKVCRPVIEFLQKQYGTPHHRILIDRYSAVLIQDLKGLHVNAPD